MEREFKKLCDLELKEGDVIEWDHKDPDNCFGPRTYTVDSKGVPRHKDRGYLSPKGSALCRVIHTNAPKLWKDMTPEEKGALLLAEHEGKTIQIFTREDGWYTFVYGVEWVDDCTYRVKPEPKVETITLYADRYGNTDSIFAKYYVTLTLIDGVVQPTATVEEKR